MTPSLSLPDPDQRQRAAVVIWDGHCKFCLSQVQRLRRFDLFGQLAYLSLHDPRVAERYPDLSHADLMKQMWVVTNDGRKFAGADAGRYLSRKLPGLWWLAPLLHVPLSMPLWRWLYGKIAERRYRLSGVTCDDSNSESGESCRIHMPTSKPSNNDRNS